MQQMMQSRKPFDLKRAHLKGPDRFPRFRVPSRGEPLSASGLDPGELILLFERGRDRQALLVTEMAYFHVAQGELDGQPYVVVF